MDDPQVAPSIEPTDTSIVELLSSTYRNLVRHDDHEVAGGVEFSYPVHRGQRRGFHLHPDSRIVRQVDRQRCSVATRAEDAERRQRVAQGRDSGCFHSSLGGSEAHCFLHHNARHKSVNEERVAQRPPVAMDPTKSAQRFVKRSWRDRTQGDRETVTAGGSTSGFPSCQAVYPA